MTYKAIRGITIYSEAQNYQQQLIVQVFYTDGDIDHLDVDESEVGTIVNLINRLDGRVEAEGSSLTFEAIFDTVSPDPRLVQWVNWATEAQERT